ncbi:MAG TPA: chloride channel protein, partial [Alphaproteobacteria bacterium]|nr:chloride channel protein [Alphaproteobacteria bacterium]
MPSRSSQKNVNLITLSIMALIVGSVTGLGAVALRTLMALLHNGLFLGQFSLFYDANKLTPPSPWGLAIILVPVIGGLGTVFLVRNFAPEAKGHGVPEVMDAIYYKEGRIRPMVVVIKAIASALSIGSGAAVGREGPIIQIGSAIGSTLGQRWRLSNWQTITLVAAGAGAGIAATFNTPLGGLMFAVELMLPEVSARTFLPVVLATGTATYVGRIFFGLQPAFLVPVLDLPGALLPTTIGFLPIYMLLGIFCGFASWAFVALLYATEDAFERIPGGPYVQSVIGMTGIGVLLYTLLQTTGNYYVDGVGYGTIQAILTNEMTAAGLLALLFFAKLLATSVSLGAGASG